MATPVIASSNTTAFASSVTSTVLTKPSGLAVGDLMIAVTVFIDAGTSTSTTPPAGWSTEEQVAMPDNFRVMSIFSKIADSSDVSASNFTFSYSNSVLAGGGIMRITGVATVGAHEQDYEGSTSTTSISYTAALTPSYTDQLVLMILGGWEATGASTMSGYTSTPSKTWTEVIDISSSLGGDPYLAIASAEAGSLTQITAYGATLSVAKLRKGGVLLLITPPQNATGSNAVFSVLPTFFSENGSAGTDGTNNLLTTVPNFPTQSGIATAPTQWQNESNGSTSWTNETL